MPPLPRAVRVSKVNLDAGVLSQLCMLGHFASLVISERAAQVHIKALQDRSEAFRCCSGGAVGELHQCDVKGLALDQRTDLRAVARTLDVIALTVAWRQALRGGAQADAGHVENLSAPVATARAWSTFVVSETQQRDRVGAQITFWHRIDRLVNCFVTQTDWLVLRPSVPVTCSGDKPVADHR